MAAHNDRTIDEHRQSLAGAGYSLSRSALGRTLLKLGLTRKKKTLGGDERETERVKGLRQSFAAQVAGLREQDLVFVDESGVNRAMTRTHARSLRGTRAFGSAPRNWGDNVSILGALTLRGSLEPMCINGSTATAVFLTFLDHFLLPRLWPGAVVVMDNLSAHKAKAVRQKIQAAGTRLLYLSPYSPDFNPIEMAWSKLKSHLRQAAARTSAALDRAIAAGWRAVSPADARGYFAHCGYCQSLPNQDAL